jgi:hypothetical protein
MDLDQPQYFYTVELLALEQHLSNSMDRVVRMREKAMKRKDFRAADQINQLQRAMTLAQRRVGRLK